MFDTLINNVKGNIDSKNTENNEIIVKGWSFHELHGVCPVRCRYDGSVRSLSIETRPDIVTKFTRNNIILCGWKFSVPINKYVDLQIKIDNDWSTFFSFNTLVTNQNIFVDKIEIPNQVSIPKNIVIAKELTQPNPNLSMINFSRNSQTLSNIYIFDNFYLEPNDIRKTAIESINYPELNNITKNIPAFKTHLEKIIGLRLDNFQKYSDNGQFKYSVAGDKIEFLTNTPHYNAIVFLTPNAPINTGLTFYKSCYTNKTIVEENEKDIVFKNGNLDPTEFIPVDTISNIFNRLVIYNPKQIHAISNHFGKDIHTGRLIQMFSFDIHPEELVHIENQKLDMIYGPK